jgi:altronate hydrolase
LAGCAAGVCENRNLSVIKQAFEEELGYAPPPKYRRFVNQLAKLYEAGQIEKIPGAKFEVGQETGATRRLLPNVDGIKFLVHEGGCGGTHEDSHNLCGLLAGYIHHPNVAGATVLSLGCQHADSDSSGRTEEARREFQKASVYF